MARADGFGRSLGFAALAALGVPVAVGFGAPLLGAAGALRLYLIALAAAYVAGIAPTRSRRLAALALALAAGAVLVVLPLGVSGTAVGAAAIVAVCRSGLLQRQRPLRAVAIETALGAVGLGVAAFLASGGLLALALAVWGYFLVQSGYFLIGGRAARGLREQDPFERASQRLRRLLEE